MALLATFTRASESTVTIDWTADTLTLMEGDGASPLTGRLTLMLRSGLGLTLGDVALASPTGGAQFAVSVPLMNTDHVVAHTAVIFLHIDQDIRFRWACDGAAMSLVDGVLTARVQYTWEDL